MVRWKRAIGADFLDWLAMPEGLVWLDAGCGTGVFTELLRTGAGLARAGTWAIEVEVAFPDFDAYWRAFLDNPSPASAFIKAMAAPGREAFRADMEARLPAAKDGSVVLVARAHAARRFAPA